MDKADTKAFLKVFTEIAYLLHLLYHEQHSKATTGSGGLINPKCRLCLKYENLEVDR